MGSAADRRLNPDVSTSYAAFARKTNRGYTIHLSEWINLSLGLRD
jgi:hypothetical protein